MCDSLFFVVSEGYFYSSAGHVNEYQKVTAKSNIARNPKKIVLFLSHLENYL